MAERRLARRVSLAVLSLAAGFLIAELSLRVLKPQQVRSARRAGMSGAWTAKLYQASEIPGLEYELRPGGEAKIREQGIRVNSLGLRGPEVTLKPAPGVVRVACVGDSFTFGHGVGDDETIPVYLEEQLNRFGAPGTRYEVLNFGVSGYSTRDEALVLTGRVLDFEPDVVLLLYCLNDPDLHPNTKLHDYFHEGPWYERSWIVQLATASRPPPLGADLVHPLHAPDSESWRAVLRAFDEIAAALDGAGVPGMVAVLPLFGQKHWTDYPNGDIHARVCEAARSLGLRTVDLLELLPRFITGPRTIRLPEPDGHTTPKGNRLIAAILKNELSRWDPERFGAPWNE